MIGVFGGTFDPIHFGHLRTALDVYEALGLRELRFVPLNVAVHRAQPVASPEQRLEMVRVAVAQQPGFVVDERELRRQGRSYTVDTLRGLRRELGDTQPLCLLIGADAFNGFPDWHRPGEILGLAHLVVMQRPGTAARYADEARVELQRRRAMRVSQLRSAPAGRIWLQGVTQLAISSTEIRRMLAAGRSPRFLLPDAVLDLVGRAVCYRRQTGRPVAAPTQPVGSEISRRPTDLTPE